MMTCTFAERDPVRTIRIACVWPVPDEEGLVRVTLELVSAIDVVAANWLSRMVSLLFKGTSHDEEL